MKSWLAKMILRSRVTARLEKEQELLKEEAERRADRVARDLEKLRKISEARRA